MKTKATFYHAGCPVCVEAERQIADALDTDRYDVELVHLGENADKIPRRKRQASSLFQRS